jgi:CysZ protein
MWLAFSLAVADTFAPAQRRVLLLTVLGTVLLVAGLWIGATLLISMLHLSGIAWLDIVIHILGSLAALFIAWVLFPAMTAFVLGFFLDGVVASIEQHHYPNLPPARRVGLRESLVSALRLAALGLALNLIALPAYLLLPLANVVLFCGINGYLVGREYFAAVAYRRLDASGVKAMWRGHRLRLVVAGIVMAVLLSIPFVGLVAPLIGVAFMLHLFEALRADAHRNPRLAR